MDRLDRGILNEIQSDFPLTSRPYLAIARRLKSSEKEILARIKGLRQRGIIRRIGGNFQSRKLNFTSTLCAAKVPPEKLERFVDTVGAGDAFTAVYIHGLRAGWGIPQTLEVAQRFAGKVIGLRGATTDDPEFYRDFIQL